MADRPKAPDPPQRLAHRRPRSWLPLAPGDRPTPVPPSFLGLSTEYWSLPGFAGHMATFARVLSMLHVPGDGPLILRVGGNSADHTIWAARLRTMPRWVFELTPAWLQAARKVVRRAGVRLMLDLNLITDSPSAASVWARAAEADLPRASIAGFEIGNEPDIYSRSFWVAALSRRGLDASILPPGLTPDGYAREFRSYSRLLRRFAPRVPLLGPEIANTVRDASWVSSLVAHTRADLGIVTAHRYPYTACTAPGSPNFPTIERAALRARVGGDRPVARIRDRRRAPRWAAVSPDGGQLGHVRRRCRRQRHVRDGPVGPGHAVRAAQSGRRRRQRPRPNGRDQRGVRIQAKRARRPAAAVRVADVPPRAGDRSQSCPTSRCAPGGRCT